MGQDQDGKEGLESAMTAAQEEKPIISWSQLNMFNTCGACYEHRYVFGRKIPPGIVMIVGSGVDGGVNANMKNKRDLKKLLPKEQVVDIAVSAFKRKWEEEGVVLDAEEKALGLKRAKGDAEDRTAILTGLHCDTFAKEINPTHVQRKMKVILDGYPRDLLGFIDIQEGLESVRDTKAKAKSMNQADADADDQLTVYAMMTKVVDGAIPKKCCLDVLVSTKVPKRVPLETTRTEEDFKPVIHRVENMIIALEKGVFTPCPESFWKCTPKYCGYHAICKYTKRPKTVSVLQQHDDKPE